MDTQPRNPHVHSSPGPQQRIQARPARRPQKSCRKGGSELSSGVRASDARSDQGHWREGKMVRGPYRAPGDADAADDAPHAEMRPVESLDLLEEKPEHDERQRAPDDVERDGALAVAARQALLRGERKGDARDEQEERED